MESTRDKFLDQAIALLHVALTTLKSAHPLITTSASAQFSELHIAVREVMDECSRMERAGFTTEKQTLEQTIASQKQQIEEYRADLDDQSECCKLLKVDLSSRKAECERLVVDANRALQHSQASGQKIALLEQQLISEKQHIQEHREALCTQVALLERKLEEERLLFADQIAHSDKQLAGEKEKLLCVICLDKPRDTLIMPCLHFHYCFCCLMQHKQANGSTCPTCRGTIQGLCMSSFLL